MIGKLYTLITGRSPKWPALRRKHLKVEPRCVVCGTDDDLDVHHVEPVSRRPDRELDASNLMTMCTRCHLLFGHLGSWQSWNCLVEMDVSMWSRKIKERPK